METAASSFRSYSCCEPGRQNSGRFQSDPIPTLTGQETEAVVSQRARAAETRLGTRIPSANQCQAAPERSSGSNIRFPAMPWTRGVTPVIRVVCDG